MKICSKCKKEKPLEDFSKNKSKKDGLTHNCKPCQREYVNAHYQNNKQYYKDKSKIRKKRLTLWMRKQKEKPCKDCNIQYPPHVMQFDHTEDNKEFDVSYLVDRAKEKLIAEIAKCEVVCANCHAERTFQRRR